MSERPSEIEALERLARTVQTGYDRSAQGIADLRHHVDDLRKHLDEELRRATEKSEIANAELRRDLGAMGKDIARALAHQVVIDKVLEALVSIVEFGRSVGQIEIRVIHLENRTRTHDRLVWIILPALILGALATFYFARP